MAIEPQIKQLQAEIEIVENAIAAEEARLAPLLDKLAKLLCPFSMDDIVEIPKGAPMWCNGRWLITNISMGHGDTYDVMGTAVKKDGTLGVKQQQLYSWSLERAVKVGTKADLK